MNQNNRDDLGYLGTSFQLKVLWQILTQPEFAENIIPSLTASYFDNQLHKFIMNMIKKYFEEYNLPPQVGNRSIKEYIAGTNKSQIEKEQAYGVLHQIEKYDRNVQNGIQHNDGEVIQKKIWFFVKQQESKKLANEIFDRIKTGDLEDNVFYFEDKFKAIMKLGQKHDHGEDVFHDIESALRENYRQPVPTGIKVMDEAMAGGLGKGEMGLMLAPYGIGKTTFLTKAANTAYDNGLNVLQIFFEDNVDDIKRKHYAIWSKTPLSELTNKNIYVAEEVRKYLAETKVRPQGMGRLVLKKMDQENTTIPVIRDWILNYQKTFGIKFDIIILDYLDCVEPHKNTHGDQNKGELIVVKAFESLLSELDIPGWSAVQGNRAAVRSEFVHGDQMGGSLKRAQKTHFLFSVAKSQEQKQENLANIQIIKSRVTKDGQVYENAIYNNDTLEIRCFESIAPSSSKSAKESKKKSNDQPLDTFGTLTNSDMIEKFIDFNIRNKNTENQNTNMENSQKSEISVNQEVTEKVEKI